MTIVSANDVWAVGYTSPPQTQLIEHWNGTQWSIINSPKVTGGLFGGVAAISSNDVWVVGYKSFKTKLEKGQETLTEHWNGTTWSIVPSPN